MKPICCRCKKNEGTIKQSTNKAKTKTYYHCRECARERMRVYYQGKGRKKVQDAVYRSMKKHAVKQNARQLLNYHLKKGRIKRPDTCSVCRKRTKVEGHHDDYTKPLEVKWMCRSCHADHHSALATQTR